MKRAQSVYRKASTLALIGVLASLVLPNLSMANCCCIRDAELVPSLKEQVTAVRDCCVAHGGSVHVAATMPTCPPDDGALSKHRNCNCSMTCCSAEPMAINSASKQITSDDSLANASWIAFLPPRGEIDFLISPPGKSLGSQQRCTLLCHWLK